MILPTRALQLEVCPLGSGADYCTAPFYVCSPSEADVVARDREGPLSANNEDQPDKPLPQSRALRRGPIQTYDTFSGEGWRRRGAN